MNKKYELIDENREDGLYRICALIDIPKVCRVGELGGLVSGEHNLSRYGKCWIFYNARVTGGARVMSSARVMDNAHIGGDAIVSGNAYIADNVIVDNNARIMDVARVTGNTRVTNNACVMRKANINKNDDYIVISNIGSENGILTAYKTDEGISVNRGCFTGTIGEFRRAVERNHGDTKVGNEYKLVIELIKLRLS